MADNDPRWPILDEATSNPTAPTTNTHDFLAQIEACRREVASWPEWLRQEVYVPVWMANHATDL